MDQVNIAHGVMEGKGAYNRHAMVPAWGGALALPFLENAVRKISLEPDDRPVVIADYGSSQGKNSLAPMRVVIGNLRPRVQPDRGVLVFHIDQPSNDFNSLFEVLDSNPDRYALDETNVFPCAIGRSFYEQVLPADSVHLGWSSYAAVWLSRIPCSITGHFFPPRASSAERAAFERQGAKDWEAFLAVRARELRPGGRLVVVLPGVSDEGSSGFADLMDHANAVLAGMVEQGAITAEERARMVLGSYPRRKSELLEPFSRDGRFEGLIVEDCEILQLPDAGWADYEANGDREALAKKQALFFRSVFMPSLASALTRVREGDGEALRTFADWLTDRLIRRLASRPVPAHSLVEIMVLAKCADEI